MITPEYLEYKLDTLKVQEELERVILDDIIRRIIKTDFTLTDTAEWESEKLQQSGVLYSDIIKRIAKKTTQTESEICAIFEDAGAEVFNYDYDGEMSDIIEKARKPMSKEMRQIWDASLKKTCTTAENLTKTTANTSYMAYINACDLAYMKIESGAFSYQAAIREAIKQIGEKGAYVMYPSGARARVDTAVRRAVLTGVNQTAGQLQLMRADELGCDLMEISAHPGARPSHAEWQGRIVSRSGKGGYLSLDDIGYGRADGFMGVNCRHNWYMYFEGNARIYSQNQLDEYKNHTVVYNDEVLSDYEASQKQRTMERAVREKKRVLAGINTAIAETDDVGLKEELNAEFERQSVKLKQREQRLADFCGQTKRRADTFRTQVYGFDRSTSGRAVWAAQQHYDIWRKSIGADDTPKTLAKYYDMKYNNKKEYGLLEQYAKSVKKGMITPLCTYSNFKALHERIENEIIGIVTSDGYEIKAQSKHFIERVVGTMADPTKAGTPIRNGVEIEDIKDALLNPVTEPRLKIDADGRKSVKYRGERCNVSINPDTNRLVQTNPKS